MNPADFDFLSRFLKEQSGLVLTSDKAYLLDSRLLPIAHKHGLGSVAEIANAMRAGKADGGLARAVVEAMTTNESFFFRDIKPFDQFRTVLLPQLLKARATSRHLRIWSAACSSGQEPYSLAMILAEDQATLAGWQVEIVATDISSEILDRAAGGAYSQFEVQRGLPIRLLLKYFSQQGDRWVVAPTIRSAVRFKCINLLEDLSALGTFDVIFCRNVLIYFDQPTKAQVLERLERQMAADGYLLLGGAETVLGISTRFQALPDNRGIYRPTPQPQRATA
jgi:chemotaxis protein methyltransferase CheR